MTLVCDSSVLFAALSERDRAHHACLSLLEAATTIVPAPVLVETDWLARSRAVEDAMDRLLGSVLDRSVVVIDLDEEDYCRVRVLQRTYADLPLEFVDAAVIAVAERLEQTRIATLDRRHFSVVRPLHIPAFELVP